MAPLPPKKVKTSGPMRVEALWDSKSMQKVVKALTETAEYMQDKFPRNTLNRMANYAITYLRAETPSYTDTHRPRPHNRPGAPSSPSIRASWVQTKFQKSPGGYMKSVMNKKMATAHGRMVLQVLEGGSRPHSIPLEPKTDTSMPPWLSFYWAAIGEFVFSRQVFHPGTKPVGMVERTYSRLLFLLDQMKAIAAGEAMSVYQSPTHSVALVQEMTGAGGFGLRL